MAPKVHDFEVLDFGLKNLCVALENERCPAYEIQKWSKASYWHEYLAHPDIDAKSIIVEPEYTDGEFLEDYSSYYVKCHREYPKKCKRLHFFSQSFSKDQILKVILSGTDSPEAKDFQDSYLGFVVARPLPSAIIGRSLIKTYLDDNGRRHYSCLVKKKVSLFGIDLAVTSLPFQEQDTVLAACATVALWSCLHGASEKFGTVAPRPATITQLANQVIHQTRPIPSHGLVVEQICRAINSVGLEPEVIKMKSQTPLASLMYAHLKRGFPVLLGGLTLGAEVGHAIAVIGYSERATVVNQSEVSSTQSVIPLKGMFIDEFYAHDDQRGPFARLAVRPGNNAKKLPITFEYDVKAGQTRVFEPLVAVIPIYNKVRVTFLDAQSWLTRLDFLFKFLLTAGTSVWDLFLDESNQLKRDIKNDPLIFPALKQELLLEPQPRYLWRGILRVNDVPVFEVFIDATDMARSLPVYRILWYHKSLQHSFEALVRDPKLETILMPILTEPFLRYLQA